MAEAAVPANHARCIPQRVLVAATRRRCPSSHEGTNPSIAAIATRLKMLDDLMIVDRAGNAYE